MPRRQAFFPGEKVDARWELSTTRACERLRRIELHALKDRFAVVHRVEAEVVGRRREGDKFAWYKQGREVYGRVKQSVLEVP